MTLHKHFTSTNLWNTLMKGKRKRQTTFTVQSYNALHICCMYLLTPPQKLNVIPRQFFKQSLTGFNSEFFFSKTSCHIKVNYLLKVGEIIFWFISFPRVLELCEMHIALLMIWTWDPVSISYDDNHYTTNTSTNLCFIHILLINRPTVYSLALDSWAGSWTKQNSQHVQEQSCKPITILMFFYSKD